MPGQPDGSATPVINLFQPQVGARELDAVAQVFADLHLGHGPRTRAFEEAFAAHIGTGADHVVFINSATAGLFLAMESLDLRPGDEVVLPSLSFLAAANAVVTCGATPVFCDVDARTLNPTVEHVERALTPRTRAVVLLHYAGRPGDVVDVSRLCRDRGITLVEDAACAVASRVGDRAAGTFGDLAVWSFDGAKVMVTGDGGMIHVKDPDQAARVRRLAYHGLATPTGPDGARVPHRWHDLHVPEPGRRVVGNDLAAAIGSVQLDRLPELVSRRARIAAQYDRELAEARGILTPPPLPADHTTTHSAYWVQLEPARRDRAAARLEAAGIRTTFGYPPLHRVPAYRTPGTSPLPGTDRAAERTLCLPFHPGLTPPDVSKICAHLRASGELPPAAGGVDTVEGPAGWGARLNAQGADAPLTR
ncbi:DegT/DnrJ/EryC1/StrS family aminotransferase [Streptomyces sp. RerS4]|uniref:DegT/DnrJ/EryC1/StrS family aminotransferase n=1 Tax=Streptomyces sp. RerS4 TaxID=2942449 RepID=UPI00201C67DD|nr:DegT/DnrJ/EryC1/StrS family aminotransferase [Streptomyces sp. RerS4]UQX05473.1 DegT/DnrJ/EryC1/StrS family aminotransferase [Streptomyces sp. RerS4]